MPGGRPARVRRLRLGISAAALTILAPLLAVSAAAPAKAAPVVQQIVVVTAQLPGAVPDTTTAADLVDTLNGPVASFWSDQTRGAVQLQATAGAPGWVTTAVGCQAPYHNALRSAVASAIGYTPASNEHLLIYIPPSTGTDAPLGCPNDWNLYSAPSLTLQGDLIVRSGSAGAIAHQIGHHLGLLDSGLERHTPGDLGIIPQYGTFAGQDPYDVMGAGAQHLGSLSVTEASSLGVLPTGETRDIPFVRGTYDVTLSPLSGTGGTRGVLLHGPAAGPIVPAGEINDHWLEFRSPVGSDSWLNTPDNTTGLQSGVLLRTLPPRVNVGGGIDPPYLDDPTPSEEADWPTDHALALTAGTSTRLGDYGYLTVRSISATQAVVRIVLDELPVPRDLDGNGLADLVAADPAGVLYRYPATSTGGVGPRVVIGRGWQARDLITMAGDWDGTGAAQDIIAREPSTGNLWLYSGNGHGGLLAGRVIGHGWQVMSALFSPGDWNGDGNVDLLARRRTDGALLLYPGNGTGGFGTARQIGSGWNAITGFAATGSFTGRLTDFLARTADGTIYEYVGDGHGGFFSIRPVAQYWQLYTAMTGVGDWGGNGYPNGGPDGSPDALVVDSHGLLLDHHVARSGLPGGYQQIGSGWTGYRLAS